MSMRRGMLQPPTLRANRLRHSLGCCACCTACSNNRTRGSTRVKQRRCKRQYTTCCAAEPQQQQVSTPIRCASLKSYHRATVAVHTFVTFLLHCAPVRRGVAAAPAVLPGVDQLARVFVWVVCCQRLPCGGVQAHTCHALGAVGRLLAAHVLPASSELIKQQM